MTKIAFTKMHGAGNDYIYVNTMLYPVADPRTAAIAWSDRHKGIGSDGLVLISASPIAEADFAMRIFNADGSEALMCGNASRCIGKYLYERRLTNKTEIRLLTLSGVKTLRLHLRGDEVGSVTVDMGEPILEDRRQFLPKELPVVPLAMENCKALFVSMGNPHYVIFTDDVDQITKIGPLLETHPAFPQRCNIELAKVLENGSIRMRVWERGSGVTMACGTGACATAVAASILCDVGRQSRIVMDGGALDIEWCCDNHIYKTGPATFVFDGEIEADFTLNNK
ncbi:MAG: diaminopimelate epimerase [Prevotella sp.]|nr:diaminopimelate epimerase [Prevotella sp.]